MRPCYGGKTYRWMVHWQKKHIGGRCKTYRWMVHWQKKHIGGRCNRAQTYRWTVQWIICKSLFLKTFLPIQNPVSSFLYLFLISSVRDLTRKPEQAKKTASRPPTAAPTLRSLRSLRPGAPRGLKRSSLRSQLSSWGFAPNPSERQRVRAKHFIVMPERPLSVQIVVQPACCNATR